MGVGFLAKVKQYFTQDKDGVTAPVVKCEVTPGEIINADRFGPSGDDSPPLVNDLALLLRRETHGGRVFLGILDQINEPEAAAGEKRLYARDTDGALVGYLWLKGDGTLELLGDTDNAVRYSELKTAFDQLKSDLNTFISTYNTHTHAGVMSGAASTAIPSATGTPSAADVSGAKIDEIKVPA